MWRPGKYIDRALPAYPEQAEERFKDCLKSTTSLTDISTYAKTTNIEEYLGPVQKTALWLQMKGDPVFVDLAQEPAYISVAQLQAKFGGHSAAVKEAHSVFELVEDGPFDDEPTNAGSAIACTADDDSADESMDMSSEASEVEAVIPTSLGKTANAIGDGAMDDDDDDDDEPYSPPPVDLPAKVINDDDQDSYEPSEPVTIQNHTKAPVAASDALLKTAVQPPSHEIARQNGDSGALDVKPPDLQPPKSFLATVTALKGRPVLPSKLPDVAIDQTQEDILAKLGVTGGPKPVFFMPGPARTEPPPGYRRSRSRSRSRSASPAKQLQNGFASHHLPLMHSIPPPPPPRQTRDITPLSDNPWTNAFGADGSRDSPRSDASGHTLAGSDFGPPVETTEPRTPKALSPVHEEQEEPSASKKMVEPNFNFGLPLPSIEIEAPKALSPIHEEQEEDSTPKKRARLDSEEAPQDVKRQKDDISARLRKRRPKRAATNT